MRATYGVTMMNLENSACVICTKGIKEDHAVHMFDTHGSGGVLYTGFSAHANCIHEWKRYSKQITPLEAKTLLAFNQLTQLGKGEE